MNFTFTEKSVKRHDVNFIMAQARSVLNDMNVQGLCTNKVPHDHGQLYTTQEASDIIASVVDDSVFYRL